jgi:hypothetical protein
MVDSLKQGRVLGTQVIQVALVTGRTTTYLGDWFNIEGFQPGTVDVTATAATVQIRATNLATRPAQSADGRLLGAITNTATMFTLDAPVKWIKAKVTARAGGTVTAYLIARGF